MVSLNFFHLCASVSPWFNSPRSPWFILPGIHSAITCCSETASGLTLIVMNHCGAPGARRGPRTFSEWRGAPAFARLPHALIAALIILYVPITRSAETNRPPNILFAIADDWGRHAGAYGTKWIKTPAFDRVAREGILFNRAYTPNAK